MQMPFLMKLTLSMKGKHTTHNHINILCGVLVVMIYFVDKYSRKNLNQGDRDWNVKWGDSQ